MPHIVYYYIVVNKSTLSKYIPAKGWVRAFLSRDYPMSEDAHPLDPEFSRQVAAFGLRVCRPLFWHDGTAPWPKEIRGASCFALRFADRIVGVTAAHVIDLFRADLARTPTLICQVHNIRIELTRAVIDSAIDLDIATFSISETELDASGAIAIDCRMGWPPPAPEHGRAIQLVGFPESTRRVNADLTGEYGAYGALATVDAVTDRDILVTYDPAHSPVRSLTGIAQTPPPRFNMSGCSGGPAITQGTRMGLHRWFPVGIIVGGSGDTSSGVTQEFDMIRIRRIDRIRVDGTIDRSSLSGWLPGR